MTIANLRCQQMSDCLGQRMDPLTLSWVIKGKSNIELTSTRLIIAKNIEMTAIVFDSGSEQILPQNAYHPNLKPEPRTRYYWTVSANYSDGTSTTSDTAFFETGKSSETWSAKWISAPFDQHPHFRQIVNLEQKPCFARAYIAARGLFELHINGEKVGDEYFTPFCNDYRFWEQVITLDIGDYLEEGNNTLDIYMGPGWYAGRFGYLATVDKLYGDQMEVLGEFIFTDEKGHCTTVETDNSWQVGVSPFQNTNIYDGEQFDARTRFTPHEVVVQEAASYDRLSDRMSPPVIAHEKLTPVLLETPNGETLLDFGQVMTGWVEFETHTPLGTEIIMSYCEVLDGGNFSRDNLRTALAEYRYISDGEKRHVRPHFTFYGFRYLRVEGVELNPAHYKGVVIHSQLDVTGSLHTSNPLLNRFIANSMWGQKGNFLDVPTDCPQRDERMGWTGDAQVFAPTASYNMHTPAFYAKYLHDMRFSQQELDGSIPFVVPDVLKLINEKLGNKEAKEHGSCAWSDAATVIPWNLYVFYGDKKQLRLHYPLMKDWVDYIRRQDVQSGDHKLWQTGFHYADWLALDNPDPNTSLGGTDPFYVASSYYLYSTQLLIKAARALGESSDVEIYSKLAQEIHIAIQDKYFNAEGSCKINTQTAQVLAIYFDFAPDAEAVTQTLVDLIEANGGHLSTGFVGTAYLCLALSKMGRHDIAYQLLLNEEQPGWLYEVKQGATTVWERWNAIRPDGSLNDPSMNSFNHYAYGAVVEWIYKVACGFQPLETDPGFRRIKLAPIADSRLKELKGSYESAYGLYRSEWCYEDGEIHYLVEIPYNAEAEFEVPCSGTYRMNEEEKYLNPEESKLSLALKAGKYKITVKAKHRPTT